VRRLVNLEVKSLNADLRCKYSVVKLLLLITFVLILIFCISSSKASATESIVDSVNIGNISEELEHNLFGFGPLEPFTHGGNWGGLDDGNLRVTWYNDSVNPSEIPTKNPDENYASAELNIPNNYIPTKIKIRALDGIADDSFELFVDNDLVYAYSDQGSTEIWKTHEIDISYKELLGDIEIKIISTGSKWSNFDKYGQLAISWINLYAKEGELVTTRLINSINQPLDNGYVEYYNNGWKEFGITNLEGNVTKLIPQGRYTFRMSYLGGSVSKRQDVGVDSLVVFSTVEVFVRLENSSGVVLEGGNVSFHSGGWRFFGVTGEDGLVSKELLPRAYSFRLIFDGAGVSLRQDVGVDSLVVFSTVRVGVLLRDSVGNPLFGGNVSYHSGGWKYLGVTGEDGLVFGEFLARKFTFRMSYLGGSVSKRQDVGVDSLVVFSTVEVFVRLENSSGVVLEGGNVSFHSGGWRFFGVTGEDGLVSKELLPRAYSFRLIFDGAGVSLRQDVGVDSLVVFSMVRVSVLLQDNIAKSLANGTISYYSSGWKSFGVTLSNGQAKKDLLPRKFTFRLIYNSTRYTKRQNIKENSIVIFKTGSVKNILPIADSNGSYLGYINQFIEFDGSNSYDPDGNIVNYTWDFGDGYNGYGVKSKHSYNQVGDYVVELTVKDNTNMINSSISNVKITLEQTANKVEENKKHYSSSNNIILPEHLNEETNTEKIEEVFEEKINNRTNSPPIAKALFRLKDGEEPIIVFDASESFDPDGDKLFYRWDFNNDNCWDTEYQNDSLVTYKYLENNLEGETLVEVSDGEKTDQLKISYIIESDIAKQDLVQSSNEKRVIIVEWWVFFLFILYTLVLAFYIYKKRSLIANKLKFVCFLPEYKRRRLYKVVTIIFKFLYL